MFEGKISGQKIKMDFACQSEKKYSSYHVSFSDSFYKIKKKYHTGILIKQKSWQDIFDKIYKI
jgi:hypothetical protein